MRTIKRYNNRKLYDTEAKRYITLEGIAELVRAGHDIEVVENDSGEDLTAVTLSQIIFEQQKRGLRAPLGFLTNLIRVDSGSPLEMLRRSLTLPGSAFSAIEKEIERRLQELVEQGEMTAEQMRRLQSDLMARFQEGERRPPERDQSFFTRFNIPTHHDLQELTRRIDTLNERLEELVAQNRRGRAAAVQEGEETGEGRA